MRVLRPVWFSGLLLGALLFAFSSMLRPVPVQAALPDLCPPWNHTFSFTITILFCQWPPLPGGVVTGPQYAFYTAVPDGDNVVDICWLESGLMPACVTTNAFVIEASVAAAGSSGGIQWDPSGANASAGRRVKVVPRSDNVKAIVLYCAVESDTLAGGPSGTYAATAYFHIVGNASNQIYLPWVSGATHTSTNWNGINSTGYVTLTRTGSNLLSNVWPTAYGDINNIGAMGIAARVHTTHVDAYASAMAKLACRVERLLMGLELTPLDPWDIADYADEHGYLDFGPDWGTPINWNPDGWETPEETPISLELGEVGTEVCYTIIPSIAYSDTVLGWPLDLGWDSFNICSSEQSISLQVADFNLGAWAMSMMGLSALGVLYSLLKK